VGKIKIGLLIKAWFTSWKKVNFNVKYLVILLWRIWHGE
jgi:hypothetical protein